MPVLKRNLRGASLVLLSSAIFQFTQDARVYGSLLTTIGLLQIIGSFVIQHSCELMDIVTVFIHILCSSVIPIIIFFGFHAAPILHPDTYIVGQAFANLQFSLLIASRQIIIALVVTIHTILTFTIIVIYYQTVSFTISAFVIYGIFIVANFHRSDYNERQLFLKEKENENWEKSISNAMRSSLIQCSYNPRQMQIQLLKVNELSKLQLGIHDQKTFTNFIRNTILMPSDVSHEDMRKTAIRPRSKSEYVQKNAIALEKFIYYMFTSPEKCFDLSQDISRVKNQTIFGTHFYFKARHESTFFLITLFIYIDYEPQIIMMVDKDGEGIVNQMLKEKVKVYSQILNKLDEINRNQMIPAYNLIKKSINSILELNSTLKNQDLKKLSAQMLLIRQNLGIFQNNMMNLEIFDSMHRGGQLVRKSLRKVNILNILQNITKDLYPLIYEKQLQIKIQNNTKLSQYTFISNEQFVYQIFFSLLHNAIIQSYNKSAVIIEMKDYFQDLVNKEVILFSIRDTGPKITNRLRDKLPLLNPLTLSDWNLQNKRSKLQLGLLISSKLIGLLGPSSNIEIVNEEKGKQLTFELYKDVLGIQMTPYYNNSRLQLKHTIRIQTETDQELSLI